MSASNRKISTTISDAVHHTINGESGSDHSVTADCLPFCDHLTCHGKSKKQKSPISKIVHKFGELTAKDHLHSQIMHDKEKKEIVGMPIDTADGNCASMQNDASTFQNNHVYLVQKERDHLPRSEHTAQKSKSFILQLQDLSEAKEQVYATFLKLHSADDLVPLSSKMMILDSELNVKKAFYALVYNGVRAALVWDTEKQEYDGMITISDFIYILVKHYKSPIVKMEEIENHTIKSWKQDIGQDRKPLIYATEQSSILDALKMLTEHKVHRLPVFDSGTRNPLHILSHKRIMKFLYLHMANIPPAAFMQKSLGELEIGTYTNVATVNEDTPAYEALSLLMSKRISALPVLNHQGKCINLYAKFDAMTLAAQKCYNNLDIPVKKAIEMRYVDNENGVNQKRVYSCFIDENLIDVIHKFNSTDVHRLIVLNRSDESLVGIVSLSDILSFIIIKQM